MALADGQQGVDGTNTHIHGLPHRRTIQGVDDIAGQCDPGFSLQRPFAIQRLATAVHHPPEHLRPDRNTTGSRHRHHPGTRLEAINGGEWHQVNPVVLEAHHFRFNGAGTLALDHTPIAHHHGATNTFQGQSHHAGKPAGQLRSWFVTQKILKLIQAISQT